MTADTTHRRILDAAFDVLGEVGLSGLTLEQVAAAADVSRQTVYRHFSNRDGLIRATVLREEEQLLDQIAAATATATSVGQVLQATAATLLEWAAGHPLLHHLLHREPAAVLPFLISGTAPVLDVATRAVRDIVRSHVADEGRADAAADVVARILLSYALHPPDRPAEEVAADLAHLLTSGLSPG
ncbi:TetR/AcrR family transcriptional regulator [Euzebya tangerina]|uniref:TetR/AcrR family transcriptional regulator n=1 Tax=Euzebya tangerina TaxID=591198 RepID=UPI000E319865|nr:TetR/AcrR family transcriptional regulator [Euzebya tangerina]